MKRLPAALVPIALLVLRLAFPAPARAAGDDPGPVVPPALARWTVSAASWVDQNLTLDHPAFTPEPGDSATLGIPIGSASGLRGWSAVVLTPAAGGPPWTGTVLRMQPDSAWLKPDADSSPLPAGVPVLARIEDRHLALAWPEGDDPVSGGAAMALRDAIATELRARAFRIVELPRAPFDDDLRAVARDAGAPWALVFRADSVTVGTARLSLALVETRRGSDRARNSWRPSLDRAAAEWLTAAPLDPLDPIPGTRPAFRAGPIDGLVLDLFVRRWSWSDVHAIFDDRIETWRVGGDSLATLAVRDIATLWPPQAPSRWPIGVIIPVNSHYSADRQEARIFYSLCSNRRARPLTVVADRTTPDSLQLVVGAAPRDTLDGCAEGCFPKLDRVSRPAGYRLPVGMPATAVARMTLNRPLIGPAGIAARDSLNRVRTERAAVLYYDEPGGTLWVSMADSAWQVPGIFGSEMEPFRRGEIGNPGVVISSSSPVDTRDRIEWWELDGHNLALRWRGPVRPGSVTGLKAGDRDGDGRDDLIVTWSRRDDGGRFVSEVFGYRSAPKGARER